MNEQTIFITTLCIRYSGLGREIMTNNGSPLWFWLGTFILALIVFICSASIANFTRTYTSIMEWPIRSMIVVMTPLLLFSIYCLRKGKGRVYSLKADTLPLVVVSLLLGLASFIPLTIWSIVFPLAIVFIPVYLLHRRALRKMGIVNIPRSKRNMRVIELECPYDEAFKLCTLAVNVVRGRPRILSRDKSRGLITAKTGITRDSWGEIITFNIRRISDNRTRIEISSRSVIYVQILDSGKNFENIEKITAFLREKCKSGKAN